MHTNTSVVSRFGRIPFSINVKDLTLIIKALAISFFDKRLAMRILFMFSQKIIISVFLFSFIHPQQYDNTLLVESQYKCLYNVIKI